MRFILLEDFLGQDFKYEVIKNKITKLLEEGEADISNYLSKLNYDPECIRKDFYIKTRALNLTSANTPPSNTKIRVLLNKL
jgi:hypothetical protein